MNPNPSETTDNLYSQVLVKLFKGFLLREEHERLWHALLNYQTKVRDYVQFVGLELNLLEDEGLAWLSTAPQEEGQTLPALISKRQLSYPVSLLLALLRRRLAEHDATSGETRLIVDKQEIAEQFKVFLPPGTNEARFLDQVEANLNKIVDLGFIRRMKTEPDKFEVLRLLKAFIDTQWLHAFDEKLEEYREHANPLQARES